MYSARFTEHVERYLDCPKCGAIISEEFNITDGDEILEGNIITCPNCKTKIGIRGQE